MKVKVALTTPERVLIVAALKLYGSSQSDFNIYIDCSELAKRVGLHDPADDGPEVKILQSGENTP